MECNAGMASMFKVITALQHDIIPKSIHFHTPNTLIDWNNIPIVVAKDNIAWKRENGKIRYAGVSGFGATGSNAHIIIGDVPKIRFLSKNKNCATIFLCCHCLLKVNRHY